MSNSTPPPTPDAACNEIIVAGIGRDASAIVHGLTGLPDGARKLFVTGSPMRAFAGSAELLGVHRDGSWRREFKARVKGAQMLVLVAAFAGREEMLAPEALAIAREQGALAVAVLAEPILAGAPHKTGAGMRLAKEATKAADSTMLFLADRQYSGALSVREAFHSWNQRLSTSLGGLVAAATAEDAMNMDFTDLVAVLSRHCRATVGVGEAKTVEDALHAAAKNTLASPAELQTARSVLAHIVGSGDMPLDEARRPGPVLERLFDKAEIVSGISVLEGPGDIRATIIAGTLDAAADEQRERERTLHVESPFFKVGDPTVYDGENLDIPAFIRKDVALPGGAPRPVPAQKTLFDGASAARA